MAQRWGENGIVTNGETQRQKVLRCLLGSSTEPKRKAPFPGRTRVCGERWLPARSSGRDTVDLCGCVCGSVGSRNVCGPPVRHDRSRSRVWRRPGFANAAKRIGSAGRVVGVDFSTQMLGRARASGRGAGADNVLFAQASAENLPFTSASVDAVLVNGFNLNPFRDAIFSEISRVLRTGGKVFAAELVLREALTEEMKSGDANWFS